jgi:hypothetical protein
VRGDLSPFAWAGVRTAQLTVARSSSDSCSIIFREPIKQLMFHSYTDYKWISLYQAETSSPLRILSSNFQDLNENQHYADLQYLSKAHLYSSRSTIKRKTYFKLTIQNIKYPMLLPSININHLINILTLSAKIGNKKCNSLKIT